MAAVEDAALFLDVTTAGARGEFVAAAARPPGRLRVALSTKVRRPDGGGGAGWAAVDEAGARLRTRYHVMW